MNKIMNIERKRKKSQIRNVKRKKVVAATSGQPTIRRSEAKDKLLKIIHGER